MPAPTTEEIIDAIATDLAEGVASATVDGNSATGMDPQERIAATDKITARDALAATSSTGGRRSPWNLMRPGQVMLPGQG